MLVAVADKSETPAEVVPPETLLVLKLAGLLTELATANRVESFVLTLRTVLISFW